MTRPVTRHMLTSVQTHPGTLARNTLLVLAATLVATHSLGRPSRADEPLPPLHTACVRADAGEVRRGIVRGLNVNEKGPSYQATPLHYAAGMRRTDIVGLLLDAGANPNARDGRGETPLHWLGISTGAVRNVDELLHSKVTIIRDDHIPRLVWMLVEGGDGGLPVSGKERRLDHSKRLEITRRLLTHGANPNLEGKVKPPATEWLVKEGVIPELLARPEARALLGKKIGEMPPLDGFILYCSLADMPRVAYFLDKLDKLDVEDQHGRTPLVANCEFGNLGVVQQLLQRGADPDRVDGEERIPLVVACQAGRYDIAQVLLNHGAQFRREDAAGDTPINVMRKQGLAPQSASAEDFPHWTRIQVRRLIHEILASIRTLVRQGHQKVVEDKIARGLLRRRLRGPAGAGGMFNVTVPWKTRLMLSMEKEWAGYRALPDEAPAFGRPAEEPLEFDLVDDNVLVAKELANICYPDEGIEFQWIARRIYEAAEKSDGITSESLDKLGLDSPLKQLHEHLDSLERENRAYQTSGISRDIVSYVGSSLEHAEVGFIRFYDFTLLVPKTEHSLLNRYWSKDDYDLLQFLLRHGTTPNRVNGKDQTLLHALAEGGALACFELARDYNVAVDQAEANGGTPLHLAALLARQAAAKWLIENGASIDAANSANMTPLSYAAARGEMEMMQTLLEAGANVDAKLRKSGRTALSLIAGMKSTSVETVKFLLSQGAEVNSLDDQGTTAITHAVVRPNRTIVEALLAAGADLNAGKQVGKTTLMAGIESLKDDKDNLQLLEWLIERGAEVNASGVNKVTPLMLAAKSGSVAKVQLLLQQGANLSLRDSEGQYAADYVPKNASNEVRRKLLRVLRHDTDASSE